VGICILLLRHKQIIFLIAFITHQHRIEDQASVMKTVKTIKNVIFVLSLCFYLERSRPVESYRPNGPAPPPCHRTISDEKTFLSPKMKC